MKQNKDQRKSIYIYISSSTTMIIAKAIEKEREREIIRFCWSTCQ